MLVLQAPVAAHEVALVEVQLSVEVPPLEMLDGLAVSVTVGRVPMLTTAVPVAEPPGPVQAIAYVVVAAIPLTSWLPLVAVLEVQPPVARHEVALVALHASVADPPLAMLDGEAVKATTGIGSTVTVAEPTPGPPVPSHDIV